MNLNAVSEVEIKGKGSGKAKIPEPGAYMGYVDRAEVRMSSRGNTYVAIMIKLTNANGENSGAVWENIMWYDGMPAFCMQKAKAWCISAHIPMEGDLSPEALAEALVHREVTVRTKQEDTADGNVRAEIDWSDATQAIAPIECFDDFNEAYNKDGDDLPTSPVDFVNDMNPVF